MSDEKRWSGYVVIALSFGFQVGRVEHDGGTAWLSIQKWKRASRRWTAVCHVYRKDIVRQATDEDLIKYAVNVTASKEDEGR